MAILTLTVAKDEFIALGDDRFVKVKESLTKSGSKFSLVVVAPPWVKVDRHAKILQDREKGIDDGRIWPGEPAMYEPKRGISGAAARVFRGGA